MIEKRLTELSKTSGWAAKIGPGALSEILSKLPKMNDKNLIVGIDTSDDAAVYKLNDEMATIQTLDAMGGKPIVALNIVCFPNCLNMNILGEILRGGADKVLEAGAVIVGGHTVQDDEPKYGLSVTGIVHPDKVLKNYGSETGDILILTKPIGLGIINTAIKAKIASKEAYEKAVKVMAYLNKYAGEIITDYNITSCTDITGFSLIGHAYEMAEPSKKTFRIFKDAIPFIKEAKEYASMGLIPAGCYENKRYLEGKYLLKNVESWMEDILFDPQTSGGLLISCKEEDYIDILTRLEKLEVESAVIGRVEDFNDAYIVVE